ncbi:hypothetical protein EXT43_05760 [Pseudoalteromonas sp. CO109Y]|nr:hypothetical protein EXT43_05760 [Pseudoalteromonas sp. CO109Y]
MIGDASSISSDKPSCKYSRRISSSFIKFPLSLLSAISYQLSAISYQLSAISYQLKINQGY